jgi:hypothetical protein
MLDFLAAHATLIQAGCVALSALVLVPLFALQSARACAWTVRRSRELHGEICECVFCDRLSELRQRIDLLENELAELRSARDLDRDVLRAAG